MWKYLNLFFISFLLIAFSPTNLAAQQDLALDSLIKVLNQSEEDTNRILCLNQISEKYSSSDLEKSLKYAKDALALGKRLFYNKGMAYSYTNIGLVYEGNGRYDKALKYYQESQKINKEIKETTKLADDENNIGRIYEFQSDYQNALIHYLAYYNLKKISDDERSVASALNSIGRIYYQQGNLSKAQEYFEKTLTMVQKLNYDKGIASTLNNLGLVHRDKNRVKTDKNELNKAIEYFLKAIAVREKMNDDYGLANCYSNLGMAYSDSIINKPAESKQYFLKALKLYEEMNDSSSIADTYINLGVLHQDLKRFPDAISYLNKALRIFKDLQIKEGLKNTYLVLAEVNNLIGNKADAYKYRLFYEDYKDSIMSEESQKNQNELLEKYNAKEREREIELGRAKNQKNELKIQQQRTQLFAFIIGFILVLALSLVILRGYRQKKKANELLAYQNTQISHQKMEIEEQNRSITDSIRYAKRIQEAILPPEKTVKEALLNSFVLFKPKDIVSGDFYWIKTKEKRTFFSAVDCTGHGVPGAFMSIIGHNGLNEAVNQHELLHPSQILDKLNEVVETTLHQNNKTEVKDGMDIALCCIDHEKQILEYAGANNPLYIIRKKGISLTSEQTTIEANFETEEFSLFEIKANKQPIGANENKKSFTNKTFDLQQDDLIYVFSDGYADQFGGPKNKKFKYQSLKELLLNNAAKSMDEQKLILDQSIESWRGSNEQIDDICIFGVKV